MSHWRMESDVTTKKKENLHWVTHFCTVADAFLVGLEDECYCSVIVSFAHSVVVECGVYGL